MPPFALAIAFLVLLKKLSKKLSITFKKFAFLYLLRSSFSFLTSLSRLIRFLFFATILLRMSLIALSVDSKAASALTSSSLSCSHETHRKIYETLINSVTSLFTSSSILFLSRGSSFLLKIYIQRTDHSLDLVTLPLLEFRGTDLRLQIFYPLSLELTNFCNPVMLLFSEGQMLD